jgi:hypothetical protein
LPSPRWIKNDACPWPARGNWLLAGFFGLIRIGRIIRGGIVGLISEKPFFQFSPVFLGLYQGLVVVFIHCQLGSKSPTIRIAGKKSGYWSTL